MSSMSEVDVSVVIPVYGSEATLEELIERLDNVLSSGTDTFEIILVDDASRDESWELIRRIQQRHPNMVKGIQLMRNFGQHNAIMCGFRYSKGALVITMDDDLQNPPEEIPALLQAIRTGTYDLIYGVPRKKRHAVGRNLGSYVVNVFFRMVFQTRGTVTSFRVVRRPLIDAILSYDLNFTYIDGLLAWNSEKISEIPVDHRPRSSGRSGYSLTKLITLALNLFTNFSLLPLQFASAVGLAASMGGLSAGAYYLAQSLLRNIEVPGYASIIVAVLTLGGLQLLALGIIGEYIGRMHLNVNRKPQYTVRHVTSSEVVQERTESMNHAREEVPVE